MKPTRIHHVQITVAPDEVEQARAFYCDVLGLEEVEKPEALKPRGGFWLALAEQQIHVGVEDRQGQKPTKAHIAYQVDDLSAWRQRLEAAGIHIGESVPIPGFARFEFRDPFGNRVEMIQPDTHSTSDS
ncbi:MAG: VOC family protein [Chloroflexota bacterium]